jgi:16S rRNA (guanine527-N7)-methyltransferase
MTLTRPNQGWQKLIAECLERVRQGAAVHSSGDDSAFERGAGDVSASCAALEAYLDLVLEWNQRVDLTAARSAPELVDLFVADAAVLAACATPFKDWVDIGTGAGAPGLPLRLLRPDFRIKLVEPLTKRTAFLRSAIGRLDVTDVQIERCRSEALNPGAHAVAVSRATWAPQIWLREGTRVARDEVWVLLAQADPPELPGWQADLEVTYRWPLTAADRRAMRFRRRET